MNKKQKEPTFEEKDKLIFIRCNQEDKDYLLSQEVVEYFALERRKFIKNQFDLMHEIKELVKETITKNKTKK